MLYQCLECDKTYNKPSLLAQHQRSHSNNRPFSCSLCKETFLRKDHLKRHALKHLPDEDKPFHCKLCKKGFSLSQHLSRHEKTHLSTLKCTYKDCNEIFSWPQSLKAHIKRVHSKEDRTCCYCDKFFTRKDRLSQHMVRHHGDQFINAFSCTHQGCFQNFKDLRNLKVHEDTEHGNGTYPPTFVTQDGQPLQHDHIDGDKLLSIIKVWRCRNCDSNVFSEKEQLLNHYKEVHRYVPYWLAADTTLQFDLPKINTATETSTQKMYVSAHIIDRQGSNKLLKNASEHRLPTLISFNHEIKPMSCSFKHCNRQFKRQYDLRRHLKWHQCHKERIIASLGLVESFSDVVNR